MTSERDIYAAANMFIKRFGEDAATQAAMRADASHRAAAAHAGAGGSGELSAKP
jgi:epoxyqueuosine reductase QueG